jgi:hypothetical protein
MTTKEQSAAQPRQRAKANPNWGLGFSLVLITATVAAYLFTAPRGVTPGLAYDDPSALEPAARVDAASIDPNTASVRAYLDAHRVGGEAMDPRKLSVLMYLEAHRVQAAEVEPRTQSVLDQVHINDHLYVPNSVRAAQSGAIDPRTQSVMDYLNAHRVGQINNLPPSHVPISAEAVRRYPHGLEWSMVLTMESATVPKWLVSSPPIAMPTEQVNWLTGSPVIVMPTRPR